MQRVLIKIAIMMGLLYLNAPAFAYYCSHNTTSGFAQIGDTMEQVQQQCGTPGIVETCVHQLTQITNTTYNTNTTYTINNHTNTINPTTSTNPTSSLGRTITITVWQYDKGPNLPAVLMEFHNGRLFQAPLDIANDPCTNN